MIGDLRPRACTYVRRNIAEADIAYSSRDVLTVYIRAQAGGPRIYIHNVYNEPSNANVPGIEELEKAVREAELYSGDKEHIIVGDFNLHDPLWSGPTNRRSSEAWRLRSLIDQIPLALATPKGIVTRPRNLETTEGSTIDLCLTSWGLKDQIRHTRVVNEIGGISDHNPIETELNIDLQLVPPPKRRNWASMDQARFLEILRNQLPSRDQIAASEGARELDRVTAAIVTALHQSIEASTPWLKINPYSTPGFTPECRELQKTAKRLRRNIANHQTRHHRPAPREMVAEYHKTLRQSKRMVQKFRRNAHRKRVEEASGNMSRVWKLAKWSKERGARYESFMPPLKAHRRVYTSMEEKAEILAETFFPPAPTADLSDTIGYDYPEETSVPPITVDEVKRTIAKAQPKTAPGTDDITNHLLQVATETLAPVLTDLFNGCLFSGYCPLHFRESKTVALRKPGKDDYSDPRAYRPITLLNTLGKALEAIVATRLSYAAEIHELLPSSHFGGRKGQSTETAIHAFLEVTYAAWEQGKTVSMLLMDVAQAYPNVSHLRLIHNLRRRRISAIYTKWILSFLEHRSTTLIVSAYTRPRDTVNTGIPQGSPLSPILYLFYNADLVESLDTGPTRCFGYIDDVNLIARGETAEENCRTLAEAFNTAEAWAIRHASVFEPKKFKIIHFARLETRAETLAALKAAENPLMNHGPGITVQGHFVKATFAAKFLGVLLDRHLTFEPHLHYAETAASKRLQAISAVAGGTWGLQVEDLRRIYTACIASIVLYASSAWLAPGQHGTRWRYSRQLKMLEQLQKNAAKTISGGFRTVAKDAFNAELHLMPMEIRARMHRTTTLARIASSSAYRRILADRAHHVRGNQNLRTPLDIAEEELYLAADIDPQDLEIRTPFAVPPWWSPPQIEIGETVLDALINHEKTIVLQPTAIRIYTDGSGLNGHTGAAAVCPQRRTYRQAYLGTDKECTVPVAELVGLGLALELAQEAGCEAIIFSDNQGALKTLQNPRGASGQHIVRHVLELLGSLTEQVALHWIPAHRGIPGNEEADRLAKEATGWRADGSSGHRAQIFPPLQPLQSAVTRWARAKAKEDWRKEWTKAKHGHQLRHLLPEVDPKCLRLYNGLSKQLSAALIQMRTGKIALRQYLSKIQAADTDECPCGMGPETVSHVLMNCDRYDALRTTTWDGREHIPRNLREFLADPKQARRSASFMVGTGLLRAPSPADPSASGDAVGEDTEPILPVRPGF